MNTDRNPHASVAHPLRGRVYLRLRAPRGRSARRRARREPCARARNLHRRRRRRRPPTQERRPRTGHADAEGRRRRKRRVAAPLLFTHVDVAVSGMTARTTVTQRFANPTIRLAGRRLRVSAAGEGRGRSSRHEDRRAADRRPDPRARRGARRVRAGEDRGPQGNARRAGAPQRVHDQRRAHRSGRGNHGHDRIPGDAALRRRRVSPALPDGRRAPLRSRQRPPSTARRAPAGASTPTRSPDAERDDAARRAP